MANRLVTIAAGYRGVSLPNGRVLSSGQSTVLTAEHWGLISGSTLVGTVITDGGAVSTEADTPNESAVPGTSGPVIVVEHGSNASVARPGVAAVYWIGDVEPDNMTTADIWNGPAE